MGSCDEILELLSAALDGALSDAEQAALDEHLSRCPACAALFAELTGIRDAAGSLEEVSAPDGFAERVMERIGADPAQERPGNVTPFPAKKPARTHWKRWAATAAVFAVVVLGAVSLPGRFGMGSGNSSMPSTADSNSSAANSNANTSSVRNSDADSTSNGGAVSYDAATPQAENTETEFEDPDQLPTYNEAAIAAACGVLTLTGDALPEGLENYESATDDAGNVTYVVPADYLFACLDQLEKQNSASFSYDAAEEETAEYGLIIVEAP